MSLRNTLEFLLRRWKRYDSNQARKRSLLILFLFTIVFLYYAPSFFRWFWNRTPILLDSAPRCIEERIKFLTTGKSKLDYYVWKSYEDATPSAPEYSTYVGNGKLGLSLDQVSSGHFYVLGRRALDIPLPFYPVYEMESASSTPKFATVISYQDGLVHRVTCFKTFSRTVSITETFYAHRFISSLFVQEIRVKNPSDTPVVLKFRRTGWNGEMDVKSHHTGIKSPDNMEYYQTQGQIPSRDANKVMGFLVVAPTLPEAVEVNGKSEKVVVLKTFVNYTKPTAPSRIATQIIDLKSSLRQTVKSVLEISPVTAKSYHLEAWKNLWKAGFGISVSKADGSLNGDKINATLYYILSQKSAFALDLDILTSTSFTEHSRTNALLAKPENCYNGHSTLQAPNLWTELSSVDVINKIVSLWLLTLEKQGCHNLIEAGAEGTMQALILSLAPLQFTKWHLIINAKPKDLHRDYFIRRLRYENSTLLNITVIVGEDNKASIFVAIDRNIENKYFYACDAGCLDPPVQLSSVWQQFPVKLTDPPTAILYITPDKHHVEELKHTIHVKEVLLAPAHEHHIIALHRHGHQLGGLPVLFWVSIVFLIVIFHLFLAKLIYNEYCGGSPTPASYDRVRYAV